MFIKYFNIITLTVTIFISGCASTTPSSMEFRSAKTSARSEKNLKKAEEWGLKALEHDIHESDASVPYFLAIEIYKPRRDWIKMAEMLDEAIKRNPTQKLEKPIILDKDNISRENILLTIEEAVDAYKDELWVNLYNGALDSYDKGHVDESIEKFKLALTVDPSKHATYIVLAKFYKEKNRPQDAYDMIDSAFSVEGFDFDLESKTELLLIKAELLKDGGKTDEAMSHYELAYNLTESISSVLSILELNLVLENYLQAIDWGNKAMENRAEIDRTYFSHLLYNIGLAYRGAGSMYYDMAIDIITKINNGEEIILSLKKDGINNLKISKDYFLESRFYFLDASVEGMDDAQERANQMRDVIEQIDDIYIPFLDEYIPEYPDDCKKYVVLVSVKDLAIEIGKSEDWLLKNYKINIWENEFNDGPRIKAGEILPGSYALLLNETSNDYKIKSPLDETIGWISKIQVEDIKCKSE